MARTIQEIYDDIIQEKETFTSLNDLVPNPDTSQTFLADLTSTSKVAIWRLWAWIIAVQTNVIEGLFDLHKQEITDLKADIITGTPEWLQAQALAFQLGDTLQFINNKFQYPTINPANQIVERASVQEAFGIATLKVARLVGGVPTPLSVSQLAAFNSYIDQIKFAGTNIQVISKSADELKLIATVTYDAQIIDNTGTLIADGSTKPVEDAINGYIEELPFDGVLTVNGLIDAVQAADGVIDILITTIEGRQIGGLYQPIVQNYNASAGHMTIDPAFPLNTNITYTV